jgi:hypothetical protein
MRRPAPSASATWGQATPRYAAAARIDSEGRKYGTPRYGLG